MHKHASWSVNFEPHASCIGAGVGAPAQVQDAILGAGLKVLVTDLTTYGMTRT